ncbi:MAG: LiaF transmembrane domain-containing protein [Acetivibrionales bacterium]|jgi:hypothetical protein
MVRRGNVFIGIFLIIIGVLFLLKTMGFVVFDIGFIIDRFWPFLFLMVPGLAFHYGYFSGKNKDAGLLVPGGILLVTGITCQISTSIGIWHLMWPGFILAVAVGLFELYLFGNQDKGLLIPVVILGGLSVIFFTSFSFRWAFGFDASKLFVPLLLVVIGIIIIFKGPNREKNN